MVIDPEPTADQETQLIPTIKIESEPMTVIEPEPATIFFLEEKPEVLADKVCEPAITSMPVWISAELDAEEWLVDWEKEVPSSSTSSPVRQRMFFFATYPVHHRMCFVATIHVHL